MTSRAVAMMRPPRWGWLYAATLLPLATLALVEAANTPGAARTVLRCGLALGIFAAMAVWLRQNRVALDLQEWCACAGEKVTVRVIESRPPRPRSAPPDPPGPSPTWAEEESEVARANALDVLGASGRRVDPDGG